MSKEIDVYFNGRARFVDMFYPDVESSNKVMDVFANGSKEEIDGIFNTIFSEGEEFVFRGEKIEGFRSGMFVAFGDQISVYLDEELKNPVLEEFNSFHAYDCRLDDSSKDVRKYPYGLNVPENFRINFEDAKDWLDKEAKALCAQYKEGQDDEFVDELEDRLNKKLLLPLYEKGMCLYTVERQDFLLKGTIELDDDKDFDLEKIKLPYTLDFIPDEEEEEDEEEGFWVNPVIYSGEYTLNFVFYNNKAYKLEILKSSNGSQKRNFAVKDLFDGGVIYGTRFKKIF